MHQRQPEGLTHPRPGYAGPAWAFAVVGLLWLFWIVLALAACPYQDTVRDLAAALDISEGANWPATGPGLAFAAHLGPAWFYLLAPVVAVSSSWLGVAVFVAALAALKFPLAYRLGRAVADWRFGLLFAVALLLPGWQHLQSMLPTHTSLVETTALAYLLSLRAYLARPRALRAFASGMLFALALHAHPAALALLPLSILAAARFGASGCWNPANMATAVVAAALPFAPYLVAQDLTGWPDLHSSAGYLANSAGLRQLGGLPALVNAILWGGPHTVIDALAPTRIRAAAFVLWALVLVLSVVALGAGWRRCAPAQRRLVAWAIIVNVVTLCTFCILRERIPWYMAYLPTLGAAGLLAAAWRTAMITWPRAAVIWLLPIATVVTGAALDIGLWRSAMRGEFLLPGSAMNDTLLGYVATPQPPVIGGTSLPARYAADSGRFLCVHPDAVLHASYGIYVDSTTALDQRLQCGQRGTLQIGGGAGVPIERHWLGMPRRLWRALDWEPASWLGPFGMAQVSAVSAQTMTAPVATPDRYPLRDLQPPATGEFEIVLDAAHGSALVASSVLGFVGPAALIEVRANDIVQAPLATTAFVSVYRCTACAPGDSDHWRLRFRAARADLLDAAALAPPGR